MDRLNDGEQQSPVKHTHAHNDRLDEGSLHAFAYKVPPAVHHITCEINLPHVRAERHPGHRLLECY